VSPRCQLARDWRYFTGNWGHAWYAKSLNEMGGNSANRIRNRQVNGSSPFVGSAIRWVLTRRFCGEVFLQFFHGFNHIAEARGGGEPAGSLAAKKRARSESV